MMVEHMLYLNWSYAGQGERWKGVLLEEIYATCFLCIQRGTAADVGRG